MPPRFRGGEAVSFRRRKRTQISLVVLCIKHATGHGRSKLLISHPLVAAAAKAAQIDSTCSVRMRPRIARYDGSARAGTDCAQGRVEFLLFAEDRARRTNGRDDAKADLFDYI